MLFRSAKVMHDEKTASRNDSPWDNTTSWRLNSGAARVFEFKNGADETITCTIANTAGVQTFSDGETILPFQFSVRVDNAIDITLSSHKSRMQVVRSGQHIEIISDTTRLLLSQFNPYLSTQDSAANEGRLTAMMPGRVVKLMVAAGDEVKKGQPLIIMEAMKMEHTIFSPRDGVIEHVAFHVGDMVPADAVLFAFVE